ncbi:MAG: peptide-methionine (S)-S-oxide reductase MsrA [Thermoleophilia bacterium]|nr:peptide-methionine (S)-S-oxide reductase MsrA [Thermoleophilia bacterium]
MRPLHTTAPTTAPPGRHPERSGPRTAWASAFVGALSVLAVLVVLTGCGGGSTATGTGGSDGAGSAGPVATSSPPGGAPAGATAIATFAAGCFWGVEARFAAIPGVVDAVVGYTGGTTAGPTYEDVCSGTTGHAEAVRLQYDPDVVSYERLVEAFFAMHDPTTLDRQGPDVGSQYRSAIFFHTPQQEAAARGVAARLAASGTYDDPIVTEIVPAGAFWRAEEYHQDYYEPQGVEVCPT